MSNKSITIDRLIGGIVLGDLAKRQLRDRLHRRPYFLKFFGLVWITLFGSVATPGVASKPSVLYVSIVDVQSPIPEDGTLLSTTLCGELAKSENVTVICEPDIKQMMDLAAFRAMAGSPSNTTSSIEQTLGSVENVVFSQLRPGKHGYILYVEVSLRDSAHQGSVVVAGKRVGRFKLKGLKKDTKSLLEALRRLSPRILTLLSNSDGTVSSPPPPL